MDWLNKIEKHIINIRKDKAETIREETLWYTMWWNKMRGGESKTKQRRADDIWEEKNIEYNIVYKRNKKEKTRI